MAGPLVRRVVLRGPAVPDSTGNVLRPRPDRESVRGGWTLTGRLRDRQGRGRWRYAQSAPTEQAQARPGSDETA